MSESEFSKALLRGEDPVDIQALTARVLRRDRRRMWFLGIVCVIAWMAVVMLPWGTVLPMITKVAEIAHRMQMNQAAATAAGATSTTAPSTGEQRELAKLMAQVLKTGTVATFLLSVSSMFVAAVCTVVLIILSRRATLRQVNARLADISNQLKAIAEARR